MASTGTHKASTTRRIDEQPPDELIFGRSPAMEATRQKIDKVAAATVPVLIQGDSGTGKGVLALHIRMRSAVATGPFVKVNCAAIPGSLLESEPRSEKASWAFATGSSTSTTLAPMAISTLRASACAHTAPYIPWLAPMTATGLLRKALSGKGREAQA